MRVGFVAEPYEETNASGMGYVVSEFLRNIPLTDDDSLTIYSSRPVDPAFIGRSLSNTIVPKGFFGKLIYFARMKRSVDVLLFIAPLLPLIVPASIRPVLICQELASQKTPVSGRRERALSVLRDRILMPLCIARSAKIVAASHATKSDIHTYYRVADDKVVVIYDGYQDLSVYATDAPAVDASLKPFFFFAGKVKARKNVHGIVEAFLRFKDKTNAPVKLVIAGDYGGGYYDTIIHSVRERGFAEDVHFAGYAAGARLYSFYTNALALVFPSFNEGFGMPPVEAMSLGLPVITSNQSSMAEVVGDAGLLVNPADPDDISRAMERIYTDSSLRDELIAKGRARSAEFSWQRAGRELIDVLRGLR